MSATPFEIKDSSYLADYERGVLALLNYAPATLNLFQEDELIDSYKVVWYEEPYGVETGMVGTGGWDIDDTTALPVSEDFAKIIGKNHILEIEGEQVRILSVNTETNVISVRERGFGGTVASAHDASSIITIVGKAEEENEITENYSAVSRIERYNFVQEFTEDIAVSARSAKQRMKDFDDLLQDEQLAKMRKMMKYVNRTALLGRKNNDTVNGIMTAGGLRHAIEIAGGVIDACAIGGTVTDSDIKGVLQTLAERGSQADTMIVNPKIKAKLNSLANFTSATIVGAEVNLGGVVSGYVSDELEGRALKIVVDPELTEDAIYIVDSKNLFWHAVKEEDGTASFMKLSEEPSDSSKRKQTLRTEITFVVKQADLMGILTV